MSHYFDEESKEWKLLKSVPNVGEIVKKWSSVKYIGNCLYLASSDADKSDIYRYHIVNKSWEKLTKSSFPKIFQCLCCVGDYVYAVSESIPPEIYSFADKIWQQGRDNLHLFAQKGLKSVAAAVMNSKLYVMHGLLIFHQFRYVPKPALVHCFDPTKDKWEKVASTCYPHFGSSLIVVNNRLYVAGGKKVCNLFGELNDENAPVEVFKEKRGPLSWLGRGKVKELLDNWSVVEQKHIPANNLGAVEIEGKVYFIINKFPVDSGIRIQPEDTHQVNLDAWENLTTLSNQAVLCYLPVKKEDLN